MFVEAIHAEEDISMSNNLTVISNGTLIDGNGGPPLPRASILIKGSRIESVAAGEMDIPADAKRIDASGKFILPGLINANVHLIDGIMLMGAGGVEHLARYEGRYHEVIEEAAQIALKNGMTTVMDTWNALKPVRLARDRINRGDAIGARIFMAGNIVGMGGPFSSDFCFQCRAVTTKAFADRIDRLFEANVGRELSRMTPAEVRARIRDYLQERVDFLKVAISDHTNPPIGPYMTFSERVLNVIVEETRRAGLPLVTHTTSVESLHIAIQHRADAMMHVTLTHQVAIPDETIEDMITHRVWGEIQPTTEAFQQGVEQNPMAGRWASYGGGIHRENTRRLVKAKAPILMGTDAGCTDPDVLGGLTKAETHERPWTLGEDHFLWFKAMSQFGMTPMDAIQAATKNVAIAYRKIDEIGTIDAGKYADILLVDQNPLEDINNIRSISMVMKEGKVIDTENLPTQKVVTKHRFWCDDPDLRG